MPPLKRILIVAGVFLFLAVAVTYYIFEASRIAQLEQAIQEREAVLEERRLSVRDYREKIAFYNTKEGLEHLAREQYNLVGAGERVFLLTSPDVPPERSR